MDASKAYAVVEAALERGMSLAQVATRLRCSVDSLRKWKYGKVARVSEAVAANVAVLDAELALTREGGRYA